MIPLLAQLGIALVSAKLQNDQQEKAYQFARKRQGEQTQMEIAARRAARAGDSGYMQAALAGNQPIQRGPSAAGPMLAGVGAALLAQKPEPAAPTVPLASGWQNDEWGDAGF